MMGAILRIAWRSVLRNWRRSAAAILAVSVGFAAFALIRGFMADLRGLFDDRGRNQSMHGDLLVGREIPADAAPDTWSSYRLSLSDQAMVERVLAARRQDVAGFIRKLYVAGLVTNGHTSTFFFGMGYDLDAGAKLRGPLWAWDTVAGQPLYVAKRAQGIVLARQLGEILDCTSASPQTFRPDGGYAPQVRPFSCREPMLQLQTMTTSAQLNALRVQPVGIIETVTRDLGMKFLATDLATAQSLLDTTEIDGYSIALFDVRRRAEVRSALLAEARRAGVALRVRPWQEANEGALYRAVISLLNVFGGVVLVASGLIAASAVFNLMSRNVAERTREVGTLRSIGYRRWHVRLLFTAEGIGIGIIGSTLGILLTVAIAGVLARLGLTFTGGLANAPLPLRFRLTTGDCLQIAAVMTGLAGGAAFLPARRAGNMVIAKALGHV